VRQAGLGYGPGRALTRQRRRLGAPAGRVRVETGTPSSAWAWPRWRPGPALSVPDGLVAELAGLGLFPLAAVSSSASVAAANKERMHDLQLGAKSRAAVMTFPRL
jgi:hypothetical protein